MQGGVAGVAESATINANGLVVDGVGLQGLVEDLGEKGEVTLLGKGGRGGGGVVFHFGMRGGGGIVPGLVKVGIGEVFGTSPDDFITLLELLEVILVRFSR